MKHRFVLIWAAVLTIAMGLMSGPAFAGGYEYPGDGARALGRGAANLARADDPMTMFINPAGLGSLMGTQFMLTSHLTFLKACVSRDGEYDPSYTDGQAGVAHEKLCNSDRFTLVPSLGVTFRASKRIGIGIGVHPPNSAQKMVFGKRSGSRMVGGEEQELPGFVNTSNGELPSPLRYMLVEDDVIVLYPTIAIGVRPLDWLQFGFAFSAGFATFDVTNYTRAISVGEDQGGDTPTSFSVTDKFVPRFVASMHLIPHDRLDIVAAIRYDDDVRAKGKLQAKTILGEGEGRINYTAPRPLWVSGGIRYAHRTSPRPDDARAVSELSGRVEDPMANEVFDLEVNVVYERNSHVRDHTFTVNDLTIGTMAPFPEFTVAVPHRWKDQLSIRAGGDWNVLPGVLALRAGASFETEGFRKGYAFTDYLPFQRYGAHAGLTIRFNQFELSGAFAHYFHKTFDNRPGSTFQVVNNPFAVPPASPVSDGDVINDGTFSGRINIGSVALRYFWF